MKTLNKILLLLTALVFASACNKDGDLIYLSDAEGGTLIASESDVVLSQAKAQSIMLSMAWTRSDLQVSDASVGVPNVLTTTLQVAKDETFTDVAEVVSSNLSKAYTGLELNTIAKNLGAEADVKTPLYFRIKASTGSNMAPMYSNVVKVNVTAYTIDMSVGFILDSKKEDTGLTLYSATSNGEYTGFVGAVSWYNYYMQEGDGTLWGNDGVDGTAFLMSSDESTQWNYWFPGMGGCYYVDVNTNTKLWSALYIPSLTVSGDLNGEMTYDRQNNKWTYNFTATKTGSVTLKIGGTGSLYDYSTGTDDSSAKSTAVGFAKNGENIIFGTASSDITLQVAKTGELSLVLDLSNPKAWSCEITEPKEETAPVSPYLYLPGIDDGITDTWTFDNYLSLYDEDKLAYADVMNVNSLWGYTLATVVDDWTGYQLGDGTAYAGTLFEGKSSNIPAPDAGLYFMDISLKSMTYNLTAITGDIYCSGFNDVWDLIPMTSTGTGVYTATVNINMTSKYGAQVVLDADWTHIYGGSNGDLSYKGDNITDDATLEPGTYTFTVDLLKRTYTFTK